MTSRYLTKIFWLTVIKLCCFSSSAALAEPPQLLQPFTANYILLKHNTAIANIEYSLTRQGTKWRYQANAEAKGLAALFVSDTVEEWVLFELVDGCIKPEQYYYQRSSSKAKYNRTLEMQFDWHENTVTVNSNDGQQSLHIAADSLDPLSLQLAISLDLTHNAIKDQYHTQDGAESKQIVFNSRQQETVNAAKQQYSATKLAYQHGSRETVAWYAAAVGYMPVKLQRLRKGKLKSELVLTKMTWQQPTSTAAVMPAFAVALQ